MDRALQVVRLGSAGLVVVAFVAQLGTLANAGRLDVVDFFSYFTIQSNLLGAASMLLAVAVPRGRRSLALELVRGAAVLDLVVTFFVVILLLSNVDVGLQLPWVDVVLHKVFPVVVVVDFLLDPPGVPISWRAALWWLAHPIAWLAYTMLRGPLAGWYPYPFLDPANGGYGAVLVAIGGIFVAGLVLIAIIRTVANAAAGRTVAQTAG